MRALPNPHKLQKKGTPCSLRTELMAVHMHCFRFVHALSAPSHFIARVVFSKLPRQKAIAQDRDELHWCTVMMVRVLPSSAIATSTSNDPEVLVYELVPPKSLPKLDLSLSIKSRFLSRQGLTRFNMFVRRRNKIGLAAFCGIICYFVTFLTPADAARVFAVLSALLYGPNVIAAFSLLRFEVVCLLLEAYDFWFSSFVSASTFVCLGLVMGDVRAIAIIFAWLGIQNNILIDANVRAVKFWVIFNVFGTISFVTTWVVVALDLVDQVEHLAIVRLKSYEVSAKAVVVTGLITVIALVVRNVYRKRHVFQKDTDSSMIECVSYRTDLKYVAVHGDAERTKLASTQQSAINVDQPEFMKTMRYVKGIGTVDPSDTLLQSLWVKQGSTSLRFGNAVHWLGVVAAFATLLSSLVGTFARGESGQGLQASEVVTFTLTSVYCSLFALHFQRKVLAALCTSFDFVFFSVQLTIVHGSLCDFLHWTLRGCLSVVTWWIWIHWVLTLDAVTPTMRVKLGLRKGFAAMVLIVYLGASMLLTWMLVATDEMVDMYSRTVWKGEVFGQPVPDVRLFPLFCNCLPTVILLCIRLVWRLVKNDFDVLLVLDGAVAYTNHLQTAKCRRSRRWGSIGPVHQSSCSIRATPHTRTFASK